jgi:hypothetical protein
MLPSEPFTISNRCLFFSELVNSVVQNVRINYMSRECVWNKYFGSVNQKMSRSFVSQTRFSRLASWWCHTPSLYRVTACWQVVAEISRGNYRGVHVSLNRNVGQNWNICLRMCNTLFENVPSSDALRGEYRMYSIYYGIKWWFMSDIFALQSCL